MSPEVSPDWLPDGWIVQVNRRDSGKVDRYFTCPRSGSTFRSKVEVLNYLSFEKVDYLPKQSVSSRHNAHSVQNKKTATARKDLPLMLPDGWILELKTRKTGLKAGSEYKCYFDPSSGRRFYSKTDVFRYINGGVTSREKRKIRAYSSDNTQISAPKHAGITAAGFRTPSSEYNANMIVHAVDAVPSQESDHNSSQVIGGFGSNFIPMQKEVNKLSEGVIVVEEPRTPHIHHGSRPDSSPERQSEQCPERIPAKADMTEEKFYDVNEETSNLPDLTVLGKSQGNIADLENREISGANTTSHRRCVKKMAVRWSLRKAISGEMAERVKLHSQNTSRYSVGVDSGNLCPDMSEDATTKQENAMHKIPTKRNLYEAGPLSQHANTCQLKTIDGKLEICGNHETQSGYGSPSDVTEKRQTRSSHRGSSGEVNEKRQTRSSHRGSFGEVNEKRQTRSSHRGSSGEVNEKGQTRSSWLGLSTEGIVSNDTRCSTRHLSNQLITKRQTRSSLRGSSSDEVIAKREIRSSYHGSYSEAGSKSQSQSSRRGSSKDNETKLLCLPCRASKRLAAEQPDITAMIDVSYRSLRKNLKHKAGSSNTTFVTNDHVASRTPDDAQIFGLEGQDVCKESKEPLTIDPGMEESHSHEAMKTDMNKKESSFESPFGDKWPDPCIEFAFRTLTGDIPLFEDSATVANYFEQTMDTTVSSSTKISPDSGSRKVLIPPTRNSSPA